MTLQTKRALLRLINFLYKIVDLFCKYSIQRIPPVSQKKSSASLQKLASFLLWVVEILCTSIVFNLVLMKNSSKTHTLHLLLQFLRKSLGHQLKQLQILRKLLFMNLIFQRADTLFIPKSVLHEICLVRFTDMSSPWSGWI